MTYPTLGYDPAPGSPGTVRGVATSLGAVAGDAESITTRLQRIGNGAGDAVWRGPAATAFHLLLDDVGPDVIRLASAHREAQDALLHYADALARAQDTAGRAESDAARATTDRDQQTSARRRAAEEAAQQDRQAWECRRQITQSQATRLLWAADPIYQAELLRYETQTRGIQHRAESLAAEARSREDSTRSAESAAAARIEAARLLGAQAAELRGTAARRAVERLDVAGQRGQAHRGLVIRVLNAADDLARSVVTSPEFDRLLNILDGASTAFALLGLAALAISPFFPPALLVAGVAGALGTAFGILSFLGTAAGRAYGTRGTGDLLWAAVGVLPFIGKGAKPGAKLVTRLLPAAKPAVRAATRAVTALGRIRPIRDVVRWGDHKIKTVPALRNFQRSDLYDLGTTGLDLIKDAVPVRSLVRPLPVAPLVAPPPMCPAPSPLTASVR